MSFVPAVKQKRHIELETFLFFKPFSASASDKAGKGGGLRGGEGNCATCHCYNCSPVPARVAQWIRRRSPKPKIGGSSPPVGTTFFLKHTLQLANPYEVLLCIQKNST
jgi:hypothetical protein